jgi:ribonuclease E
MAEGAEQDGAGGQEPHDDDGNGEDHAEEEHVESLGGDDSMEEPQERAPRPRRRQYKIQEVIKRRQVMLVQVVKEERGTKGAALTTYLSLAGRYSVLMPNTARGGGISRKITSSEDRSRLKEIAQELEVPEGMGVILRTAGASRTKTEVKRDFEYLLRLWETVRDFTLKAVAPTLVYEEGSLIKRSIRDLYHKDIDEIVVEGEPAYHEAKDFMGMLMPSHVKNVKLYRDQQPIFTRFGCESQLDAMFSPTVQLKSGGYIVINQAEALVAIDVNSGRATREHNIEDTALKTNSEAAAEIARQLRLRDLAGLIVIDFIDMDENRNNRSVERKLKESLKSDRARIQVGRISHFGLMEMSRQRIRTSVLESSTETCPHCGGTGHVRSVSSVALQLLRSLEDLLVKGATHNLIVRTRSDVALYVLNHKRAHLRALEERFRILIAINADATMTGQPPFTIDRGEQVMTMDQARALMAERPALPVYEEEEQAGGSDADMEAEEDAEEEGESAAEGSPSESSGQFEQGERDGGRRRRRGRRGRGGKGRRGEGRQPSHDGAPHDQHEQHAEGDAEPSESGEFGRPDANGEFADQHGAPREDEGDGERKRRRRGRRGGRRNRRGREGNGDFNRDGAQDHAHASDFSSPAPMEQPAHHEPSEIQRDVPSTADATAAESAPAADSQAQRRRSTVREAAPGFSSGDAPQSPPPETPASAPAEGASSDQPRRFGWWSRKS